MCNYRIIKDSKHFETFNIKDIKAQKIGLLLGTAPILRNGSPNLYFEYRIQAAFQLFKNKSIQYLVISGDHGRQDYNEPQTMKDRLVAMGIADSLIFLDYAGFRTFDSVIRLKEIFGQTACIIISQQFHNQRAIYIARQNDILAYGYNAKSVSKNYGFKTNLREKLARVKLFLDQLIDQKPKFLGDKIIIPN